MVLGHNINEGERTQDIQIEEDITFDSILLTKTTLSGLKKSGFYKPSPIQLHGIPLGKCGFDLLLEAKSGTGKTAVFTVIALENLDLAKGLQVIILAPTREIAAQICDVIKQIGSDYSGLNVEVVMGGLPVKEDIFKFTSKQVHIVVGSPGRLKHLIMDKHIDVSAVRLLVLDECDKLVDKSFLPDIHTIFSILPKQKQVIMCSATYPENCKIFINKYVHNAQHICPNNNSVLLGITQKVTVVQQNNNIVKQTQYRFRELLKILTTKEFKQCLIFCNYQARVGELHKLLTREKWPAKLLYGQQGQIDRLDALKTLQEYKCRLLISTDLAARGIDASNVDLVINFEPPFEWQTYLHRIGRAGRYGSFGTAITILSEGKEVVKFKEVFQLKNLSLNLRNLWTDDEFVYSSHNIFLDLPSLSQIKKEQTEKEKPLEVTNDGLWNILTSESEKKMETLQTFEALQNSFQTTNLSSKNNIETFSDLVTSFQQYNYTPNEDVIYSHMNFRKIYIKQNLTHLENWVDDNKEIFNGEITRNINKFESTEENNNCEDSILNKIAYDNDNPDDENINFLKNSLKIENNEINEPEQKNACVHKEENMSAFYSNVNNDYILGNSKALSEAGLPTSFGKTKKRCLSKKLNSLDCVINSQKLCSTQGVLIAQDLNRQNELNTKHQNSHKGVEESTRIVTNSDNVRNKTKQNLKDFQDKEFTNVKIDNKTMKNNSRNYEIWYKSLKACMKQMEYVVYMDEMSKLNAN